MKTKKLDPTIQSRALRIVKKFYPEVETVEDATRGIEIEVTPADNSARRRNHKKCALAVACERALHADGAIISVSTAYIVKGKKAIRFRVPESVAREVTSFDRNSGFDPGVYNLVPSSPADRLGISRSGRSGRKPYVGHRHITGNIRTSL